MGEDNLLSQVCDLFIMRHVRLRTRRKKLFISVITISFLFWLDARASLFVKALRNRPGSSFNVVSAKPCQNALGKLGTCMFMWDCIKSEGTHLGTCSDRFLFGSCCQHNSTSTTTKPSVFQPTKPNNNDTQFHLESKPQYLNKFQTLQTTSLASLVKVSQSDLSLSSTTTSTTTPSPKVTRPFIQSTSTFTQNDNDNHAHQNWLNLDANINNLTSSVISNNDQYNNVSSNDTSKPMFILYNEPTTSAPSFSNSKPLWNSEATTIIASENSTSSPANFPIAPQSHNSAPISSPPQSDSSAVIPTMSTVLTKPIVQKNETNSVINTSFNPAISSAEQTNVSYTGQYQSTALKPTYQLPMTTFSAVYMNPLAPAQSNQITNTRPQQQNKPQGVSWLSRPSLLANAIFHSFKPYLNGNRHRPTYKPYINAAYRPQHYRPTAQQQVPPQRPQFSFDEQRQQQQQQQQPPSPVSSSTAFEVNTPPEKISGTNLPYNNDEQNTNNDHHIVNPSTSSMTDRHRPMDKNHYSSDGILQQSQKQQNHYELMANSSSSTYSISSPSNISLESVGPSSSPHYELINTTISHSDTSPETTMATTPLPIQSNTAINLHQNFVGSNYGLLLNNNNQHQNNSPSYPMYPLNQSENGQILTILLTNQSRPFPSSPMISSFPNHIVNLPTIGSIDEIYGLSTVSSTNEQYNKSNQTQSISTPPGSTTNLINTVNQADNQASDYLINLNQQTNIHTQSISSSDSLLLETTTLPPGTVLIGNIDEPPIVTTSSIASQSSTYGTRVPPIIMTTVRPSTEEAISAPTSATSLASSIYQASSSTTTTTSNLTPSQASDSTGNKNQNSATGGLPSHIRDPNGTEAACGVTSMYPQTKVVGGKNAAFGAWPWQVSVRKVSFFGFSSTHRCGGAVISSEWIATAGHCVEDLALQSIRIRVGEYDFSSMSEPYPHIERAARRKVVHPKYNFYTYENDLALVQLDQPLQFPPHVSPICLPPDNIDLLGRNATVTGWGRLNEGGTLPTVLQEVRVPIVSNDKCKDMFLNAGRPEYIPDIFLCAGYEEGGRDSCQGDSGGPLQVRGDDGKWFLAGIISWGIGCAEQNLPGVCTRISRFKLWIQSTMSSSS